MADPALLRPGKEWVGGGWRDREPPPVPGHLLRRAPPAAAPPPPLPPAKRPVGRPRSTQHAQQAQRDQSPNENKEGEGVLVRRSQRERQERVVMVRAAAGCDIGRQGWMGWRLGGLGRPRLGWGLVAACCSLLHGL